MSSKGYHRRIRKMGFISDQEGIMNRYLREKDAWKTHLKHTRDFIKESFHQTGIKTVGIMGSGWLLDLPVKTLSKRFEKVLLLDIYHPPQVRKRVKEYDNVYLQEADLTGGAVKFAWKMRKKNEEFFSKFVLDDFSPSIPELEFNPDAFISLNILNQLDILVVDFIKKKHNCFLPAEYDRFRQNLQQFHIDWISQQPGCLVSDMTEHSEGENGEVTSTNLVHADLPEFTRAEEWTWDFDLSGMYLPGKKIRFSVRALEW